MDYQLIVFDLDKTLTESRGGLDKEMSDLLCQLIAKKYVAVISGAAFAQFQKQLLDFLPCSQCFDNLYIAPLSGGGLYSFQNGGWKKLYEIMLDQTEKQKIMDAFSKAFEETEFRPPQKIYGVLIEDRGGQITFSALGNEAPRELKEQWDPNHQKRAKIKQSLEKYLPDYTIEIGGLTSIDVRPKGIDKGYEIKKVADHLSIPLNKILFVGDAVYAGGNDYSATQLKEITIKNVSGPAETKKIIYGILY